MKYRKRPVVVEAMQWDGSPKSAGVIVVWSTDSVFFHRGCLRVCTLEGIMQARVGDYIIRGVGGEYYPCRADIFEATYERE